MTSSLSGSHVLVTGGTGFVGSYLVPQLCDAGAAVTVVASGPGWREPVGALLRTGEVRLLSSEKWWTARAAERIAHSAGRVDHLVHLAYVAPSGAAADRAVHEVRVNLLGTVQLVAALGGQVGHVCVASSTKVYGDNIPLPAAESSRTVPASAYGAAKLAVEDQLRVLSSAGGPTSTALRLSTLYGPMETVPRAVPNFIRAGLSGAPATIRGSGREIGDYLHVRDAARAFRHALEHSPDEHRVVNAGTGHGVSTVDLAHRVALLTRAAGHPAPPPQHMPGGGGRGLVCDVRQAEVELRFKAEASLDEGLAEEIEWFEERPELWAGSRIPDSP